MRTEENKIRMPKAIKRVVVKGEGAEKRGDEGAEGAILPPPLSQLFFVQLILLFYS
jgi:hypothetical protein